MTGFAARAVAQSTGQTADEAELPRPRAETPQDPAPGVKVRRDLPAQAPDAAFMQKFEAYGEEIDYQDYDENWKPPELLDAPAPRPGFVQRWIAVVTSGDDDAANLQKAIAEGWRPRDPATCPSDWKPPTISDGNWAGTIGVRGMVLMERPRKLHKRYADATKERTKSQLARVRSDMFSVHQQGGPFGKPVMESRSRVTGRPSVAPADDDD